MIKKFFGLICFFFFFFLLTKSIEATTCGGVPVGGVCGTGYPSCNVSSQNTCPGTTCTASQCTLICTPDGTCECSGETIYCAPNCPSGWSSTPPSGSYQTCTAACTPCGNSKTCYKQISTPTPTPTPNPTPTPISPCPGGLGTPTIGAQDITLNSAKLIIYQTVNASKYYLRYWPSGGSAGNYIEVTNNKEGGTYYLNATGLSSCTTYNYQGKVWNSACSPSEKESAINSFTTTCPTPTATPTPCPPLPAPTLNSPADKSTFSLGSYVDLIINPVTYNSCGPGTIQYRIPFTSPSGTTYYGSWSTSTSRSTGPYNNLGTATWWAEARFVDNNGAVRATSQSTSWEFYIVAPTPTSTPTLTPTPTPACPSCPLSQSGTPVSRSSPPNTYNIFLSWSNVNYEDGYKIYRCQGSACSKPSTALTTLGANTTSYTDTNSNNGFTCGTTWSYWIVPIKTGCTEPSCTRLVVNLPACPTPTPSPTPTSTPTPTPTPTPACPSCPSWVGHSDILRNDNNYNKYISWNDVTNEDGYKIYLCATTPPQYCTPTYLTTLPPNTTSYAATNNNQGFAPGSRVIYEVRPYKLGCSDLVCANKVNNFPTPTPTSTPIPTPTPEPVCICGGWQNQGCGLYCIDTQCQSGERCQLQYCYYQYWDGRTGAQCDLNSQCITDETCQNAWFQIQEGDVHVEGEIFSKVPEGKYFSLEGIGGYPGLVSYETSAFFSPGEVSSKGWLVRDYFDNYFDYDYFYEFLDSPTYQSTEGEELSLPSGDIAAYNGNFKTASSWNVGTRKMVVLIKGKFLIKDPITVDQGGSLLVVARGGIGVSKDISSLTGLFFTDQTFFSSVENDFNNNEFTSTPSNKQLIIYGGVYASSFDLSRDLGYEINQTNPAEKFIYQPNLLLDLHHLLWQRAKVWQEEVP